MGMTAENVAERYGVTRADQDAMAVDSHTKALAAQAQGKFEAETVLTPTLTWTRTRTRTRTLTRTRTRIRTRTRTLAPTLTRCPWRRGPWVATVRSARSW